MLSYLEGLFSKFFFQPFKRSDNEFDFALKFGRKENKTSEISPYANLMKVSYLRQATM